MADAHRVEAADGFDDLGRRTERAVALGSLAKIHRIALAEGEGRRIERLFIGVVDCVNSRWDVPKPRSKTRPQLLAAAAIFASPSRNMSGVTT